MRTPQTEMCVYSGVHHRAISTVVAVQHGLATCLLYGSSQTGSGGGGGGGGGGGEGGKEGGRGGGKGKRGGGEGGRERGRKEVK